jgi:hypothetical protein
VKLVYFILLSSSFLIHGCSTIERESKWLPKDSRIAVSGDSFYYSSCGVHVHASMSSENLISIGPPILPLFPLGLIAPDDLGPISADFVISSSDTMRIDVRKVIQCFSCRFQPTIDYIFETWSKDKNNKNRSMIVCDTVIISPTERRFSILMRMTWTERNSIIFTIKDIDNNPRNDSIPLIRLHWKHNYKYRPASFNYLH